MVTKAFNLANRLEKKQPPFPDYPKGREYMHDGLHTTMPWGLKK